MNQAAFHGNLILIVFVIVITISFLEKQILSSEPENVSTNRVQNSDH